MRYIGTWDMEACICTTSIEISFFERHHNVKPPNLVLIVTGPFCNHCRSLKGTLRGSNDLRPQNLYRSANASQILLPFFTLAGASLQLCETQSAELCGHLVMGLGLTRRDYLPI